MKKENRSNILLRYVIVIVAILGFAVWILTNAFDNTVVHAREWNEKAMAELSKVVEIRPERGNILAEDGQILATNLTYYHVRIDYRSERFMEGRYLLALDSLSDSLARYFPARNKQEWMAHLKKPLDKPKEKRPRAYKIISNISYSDWLRLRTFPFFCIPNPNKNGLTKERVDRRAKPYGAMAARSIGAVGIDSVTGEIHGISGLERALDTLLYGKPGIAKKVPLTKDIVNWTDIPAKPGYNIRTTIDIDMQDIVETELNEVLSTCHAEWGVAVLMEVATGKIKAISNLEEDTRTGKYIEAMNRAVLGYEPGSVVKTLSMMIAVEDGIVSNPDSVIQTGFAFPYAGGRPITDSHGAASMPVCEVIERSSNIGMAKIITSRYDRNPGAFYSRLKQLGFLDPMNTGIAGELTPRIDSMALDVRRGGRVALSRMCYGYSTEIPPLYTLSIYNAIANDGIYVKPRLVDRLESDDTDSILPAEYIGSGVACSPRTARIMRDMLTRVVWGEHGTGKMLRNDRVRIAGKTGTCYVIDRNTGTYNTGAKRLAFCGFFPAEKPLYSCIVLTCRPRENMFGAASTSGTVLKNIALKMYSRGMLDNASDYHPEEPVSSRPTLYATTPGGRVEHLRNGLAFKRYRYFNPTKRPSGMPNVVGHSLRDAIHILEEAGVNVDFRGAGYVTAQSVSPGSPVGPRSRVTLTLAP